MNDINKAIRKSRRNMNLRQHKVDTKYKFTIGKNEIEIDLDKNTVIYGMNGTGKTRLLNTLYGINNNKNFLVELSETGVESTEKIANYKVINDNIDLLNEFLDTISMLGGYEMRTRREVKELQSYINDKDRDYDPQSLQFRIIRLGKRVLHNSEYYETERYSLNRLQYARTILYEIESLPLKEVHFEKKANVHYLPTHREKDSIDKLLSDYITSELIIDGNKKKYPIFEEIKILEEKCVLLNNALKPYLNIKVSIDMFNKEFILNDKLTFDALSSGEKNIVIIFATIIFLSSDSVLLIDEPEISFSMNYQNSFITDVLNANPEIKYIIATHSPFIFKEANQEEFSKIELKAMV